MKQTALNNSAKESQTNDLFYFLQKLIPFINNDSPTIYSLVSTRKQAKEILLEKENSYFKPLGLLGECNITSIKGSMLIQCSEGKIRILYEPKAGIYYTID